VIENRWTDYAPPVSRGRAAWNLLRYLRHLEFHKLAHALVPPMRAYLYIRAVRAEGATFPLEGMVPPMASTREFAPATHAKPGSGRDRVPGFPA